MIIEVLSEIAISLLSVAMILLFFRAILSAFAPDSDNPIVNFVFNVTDVLLAPAQFLVDKTGFLANSALDGAYLITVLAIWILEALFLIF